ncbi:hypothetical protein A6M21_08865 [Desulfotomaculum copahuensis]|uniref:Cytoplasmic protein n=1 Tax=Desulfotomaculum copahuensis TaxID=1838280 RepID=A0A1B7LFC2_9FIRM|nr:DUF503 domain-containing protein [Desulfotomaculum copahuensis]OAT82263.1 hypothetical protein A6M21_08865 [Desulfotomaculum copahuensis]
MVVGLLTLELFINEATSLKGKRRVLKSLLDKVKARYNVSAAEVGKQDAWQFSTVGVSFVSNESAHVHRTLAAVIRFVQGLGTVEVVDVKTELL